MSEMTAEQIDARCRRMIGLKENEGNGLMSLPLHEQSTVLSRAYKEELAEHTDFSPMIWAATFIPLSRSAWPTAVTVEGESGTVEEHTEPAIMAFMENIPPETEFVWRGIIQFLDDLLVSPGLIRKGLDRLEDVSTQFLNKYDKGEIKAENKLDEFEITDRAEGARQLMKHGLPELRRRLDAWEKATA